ncbi:MAG TPA: hypothetical protein VFZ91_11855 [Allosphingosinicella sp.]
MDSSADDRLAIIAATYQTAMDRRADDIAQAQSDEQADAIRRNLETLELAYLKAERAGLQACGADVEAAYQSARTAADDVSRAYRQGHQLADRIRAVAGAATAVTNLVAKAATIE